MRGILLALLLAALLAAPAQAAELPEELTRAAPEAAEILGETEDLSGPEDFAGGVEAILTRLSGELGEVLRQDLLWLGLPWDEETPPQSRRTAAYEAAFGKLQELGLLYPCYCTRSQLHSVNAPHRSDGTYVYPGTCRGLSDRERAAFQRKPAWRLLVPDREYRVADLCQGEYVQNLSSGCGDFVVRRADGVFVYQLAVTVDDGDFGVTQVVRGVDLLGSAPRQMYLQDLLGYAHPEYGHVPLLTARDGRRLSKRDKDLDLGRLRLTHRPEALVGWLAWQAGLLPRQEAISPWELAEAFSWEKLKKQEICVDLADLLG